MGNFTTKDITNKKTYNIRKCMNVVPNKKNVKYGKINPNESKNKLFLSKCNCRSKCKCNILAYYENIQAEYAKQPAFYSAFCEAYNNHYDIILSPDDIWLIICLQFTKYVNANSEKMRNLFVSHQGKKKLVVVTELETDESEWNEFFELILNALTNNVKGDVVDLLQANFSTTTHVEKLMSTAVIMDTFKTYFDYGRLIPMCGLRNLMFMGTLDDWTQIQTKLNLLETYAVDEKWKIYINNLKPIITEFINSYNGNVNIEFWDKIMNIRHGSLGSGSTSYVSGWILNFYGIYDEVDASDIDENYIDVSVEIDNKMTGIKKNVNIVGGFTGVAKVKFDEYIGVRPQMSFIVYHDGTEIS